MKIFKKLLSVSVAAAMCCGVVALSACGPDGAKAREEFIDNIEKQSVTATDINSVITAKNYYGSDCVTGTTTVNAKIDFAAGNGDILYSESVTGGTEEGTVYGYAFLREWDVLVDTEEYETEVTDYSVLNLVRTDIADLVAGQTGTEIDFSEVPIDEILSGGISFANYMLSSFANAAGALTVENGTAVIDLNKAVYNFAGDIKTLVNGITAETTVGDLLDNATVRKYAMVFTELASTEDVQTGITQLAAMAAMLQMMTPDQIAEMGEYGEMIAMAQALLKDVNISALANVKPDKNSTTYDYIVKILKSDEFNAVVSGIVLNAMSQGTYATAASMPVTISLTDMKVGELLAISSEEEITVDEALKNLRDGVAKAFENITETAITVIVSEEDYDGGAATEYKTVISDAKITYTVDGEKITGQSVVLKIAESVDGALSSETEVSVTVDYSDTVSLVDISNANVVTPSPDGEETVY